MAKTVTPVLESWIARRLLLTLLCAGGSIQQASEEIHTSRRAVMRYLAKHPEFSEACRTARELAKTNDPEKIEAFIHRATPSEGGVEEIDRTPIPSVQIVPAPPDVVDPDVMDGPPPEDPDLLVPGLPPLTERNLIAFHWRTMHDRTEPSGLRSACTRALHEHTLDRSHRRQMMQLDPVVSSRRAPARERGLTRDTTNQVLRAIIGPPPKKRDESA